MLELRGVRHRYDDRTVLDLAEFTLPRGGFTAIVGHNGSGKSTLLRLLALLERPTEGEIWFDGRRAIGPRQGPALTTRRRITLVEQRPILFRGGVRENLGYGLAARGMAMPEIARRITTTAERLGIDGLLDRTRRELSEGEVQRVAVARALALGSDVLLLDEPLSSADRAAAATLFQALQEERRARGATICLASHQLEDAYRWSDDIRALAEGRLSPVTPENLFRVQVPAGDGDAKSIRVGPVCIVAVTDKTGPAILAVPPTDILVSLQPVASSARNVFTGRVTKLSRSRPGTVHLTADVGVDLVAVITERAAAELGIAPGSPVTLAFKANAVQVF